MSEFYGRGIYGFPVDENKAQSFKDQMCNRDVLSYQRTSAQNMYKFIKVLIIFYDLDGLDFRELFRNVQDPGPYDACRECSGMADAA